MSRKKITIRSRFYSLWQMIGFLCSLLSFSVSAENIKTIVIIPPKEKTSEVHAAYFPELLQLVLSKTEATDGPYEVREFPQHFTGARFLSELKHQGVINVFWSVTTPQLEADLLPIKIPILKGLNEYRIFLIRTGEQFRFDPIKNLSDLRELTAGQGSNWLDTKYLIDNDLPVVTTPQFELLFTMLLGKRFDYFPRGLDEVWNEADKFANRGISIENHLMFHYKAEKIFFVAKENKALADRIERGLKIAQADGSFDALFNSIPGYQRGLNEIQNNKRLIFNLSNASD